jgi:DNA-binding ferritin-like protein (Dps family)
MGAVFRPKDFSSSRKKIVENAIKDLSPDAKDHIIKILHSWEGTASEEEKLKQILGQDKAKVLLKKIRTSKKMLTAKEREELQDMFKESLTFD